jgi:hypothetical protein
MVVPLVSLIRALDDSEVVMISLAYSFVPTVTFSLAMEPLLRIFTLPSIFAIWPICGEVAAKMKPDSKNRNVKIFFMIKPYR